MKRIISLILVLATAFLMLTGCAFRYSKKDMSKYAEFDETAFKNALQALSITLGDFLADDTVRAPKVNDAVAQALLKATDANKKFSGTLAKYDSVYFCYYATDANGNIFYGAKLDESKPTNIQLGLSTLDGLNAAIAEALLGQNIQNSIYSTSATNYVKYGDVVSVSYFASWDDDGNAETPDKTEVIWNQYVEVTEADSFSQALILNAAQVGVEIPHQFTATVKDGGVDIVKNYSNVKVESLVKGGDNRTDKVADGDVVYVSYVMSFKAEKFFDGEKYVLPTEFDGMDWKVVGENVQITVSYEQVTAVEAAAGVLAEAKTFENQLVGKTAGSTTSSIKEVGALTVGEDKIDIEYTNVKVNWIKKSNNPAIQFTYTPYPDAYVEADKNEKTEKNIYGKAIRLNEVELTYHILPIYYIDVVDYSNTAEATAAAEFILTKLYSVVTSTKVQEHEHVEGEDHDHEEMTEFVFATINDNGFKKGDKTLATLVTELSTLATTLKDKTTALTTALTSLNTAQKNLASTTYAQTSDEWKSLKTALENAETAYITAKTAEQAASATLNEKVKEILECTKGEEGVAAKLVEDYKTYHYDTLDAAFRADIKDKLSTEIIKVLKSSVTFKDNLPKKAVKEAYNAIMDSYQYDFYEGKYSATGSTSSSTSTETNYAHYDGSFNRYLIDKVVSGNGGMKEVKAAIKAKAEAAVKEIMYVYIFTQMVESAWDTELALTKEEKKNIELNLEYQAYQIQMYYGVNYEYDLDSAFHGSQFDKVMEFLLTSTEAKNDKNVEVDVFTNISYTGK